MHSDKYPYPTPNVLGKLVAGEAVLVLPEKGQVKVLNEVGARIWSLVDGNRSVADIAAIISHEYLVDLESADSDALAFLTKLEERGIVAIKDVPEG